MTNVDNLNDYEREALEKFLALPGASQIVQAALAASHTGTQSIFTGGSEPTFALVAIGDDAFVYRHAFAGIEQAVGFARSNS